MSRSGYIDDYDDLWPMIRWRGAVTSAIKGRRGQAFLREMLAAMDAVPTKRLIKDDLARDGEFCAIGTVGAARGINMAAINLEDSGAIAKAFGVASALAREIMWRNDDAYGGVTPEQRFARVRKWVAEQISDQQEAR